MSLKLARMIPLVAVLLVANAAFGDLNPMHNPTNAYDVDNNNLITPHDFLLIVNQIQRQTAGEAMPLVDSAPEFYWDTSDNGFVSPHDALLVANHLTTVNTPEPSTYISAGFGLLVLGGYCWRRRGRRHAAA